MTDPATLSLGAGAIARRTAQGIELTFPVLRAPGAALGLGAFALLCGLMPALGLSALLPLDNASASAMVSLALIGGFAAPFILACVVFALLAIYQMANSLHVDIGPDGARSQRRVFGCVTARKTISRLDITEIEPRISSRYQNMFSAMPRYTLVAKHADGHRNDVIIAEDLAGQALMAEVRMLAGTALSIKISQ